MNKTNCYLHFKEINSVLEELDGQTEGLCGYKEYIPETIPREDPNMLHVDFIGLYKSHAKSIISITETLVLYSELNRTSNQWNLIEEEFDDAVRRLLKI